MPWFKAVLIGLLAVGALLTVLDVGKPRKPGTASNAAMVVLVDALLIWGIAVYF